MKVLQCWDDGVVSDIRLIEILKKYNATATFNLCIGKNGRDREVVGQFEEVDIVSLKRSELYDLYKDFDVANHSLTHPFLSSLSYEEVHHEVAQNKAQLEAVFHREIKGFCYPFGSVNSLVKDVVKETGHQYARTVDSLQPSENNEDNLMLKTSCHFLDPKFWTIYTASKEKGIFYFWGHSFEIKTEEMWVDFEDKIRRIANDKQSVWGSIQQEYK